MKENKRAELISAIIGIVIGSIIGAIMSVSYWNETKKIQELREENKTLKEIIWQQETFIEQKFQK
jgi:uncharacterized membrane-anchored protein YhcB (DUF1043 family)